MISVTSLVVPVLLKDEAWATSGVSLSLNVQMMSPAVLGDKLRAIATTKAGGKRTVTIQGEVRKYLGSATQHSICSVHFVSLTDPCICSSGGLADWWQRLPIS